MKEINDQSYVVGIGIDAAGEDEYVFTFQKAVLTGISSAADSNSIEYQTVSVRAGSIADAVRNVTLSSSTELSFEHLSCVLIGNSLIHGDFVPMLEYLMQQPDVRRQCTVAAATDSAEALLRTGISGDAVSLSVASMLRESDSSRGGTVVRTLSSITSSALSSEGYCLYAVGSSSGSEISASDADNAVAIVGACVFGSEGLTGTLSADEADLLRLFAASQSNGLISAAHSSGKTVYFWINRSRCHTSCRMTGDRLFCDVTVTAECSIADPSGVDPDEIDVSMLENALRTQLLELLDRSQTSLGAAPVRLDDAARRADHRWYAAHRQDFSKIFRAAEINLEVDCHLERSGVVR